MTRVHITDAELDLFADLVRRARSVAMDLDLERMQKRGSAETHREAFAVLRLANFLEQSFERKQRISA